MQQVGRDGDDRPGGMRVADEPVVADRLAAERRRRRIEPQRLFERGPGDRQRSVRVVVAAASKFASISASTRSRQSGACDSR